VQINFWKILEDTEKYLLNYFKYLPSSVKLLSGNFLNLLTVRERKKKLMAEKSPEIMQQEQEDSEKSEGKPKRHYKKWTQDEESILIAEYGEFRIFPK
jgi:hypothetical protein